MDEKVAKKAIAARRREPRRGRGRRTVFTAEENKARQEARNRARLDAVAVLVDLHRDEYRALYRAACVEAGLSS